MSFDTISVVGLGYIGLPTAAVFASRKKKVIGVDVNQDAVDSLKSDHIYSKVDAVEKCSGLEPDYSSEAENLALGTDFFLDSQSVLCREETIQDEDTSETSALVASQVSRRIGWKN